MNLENLFRDFRIPYATEGKNCQPGWLNVRCPFCDDRSNHLGGNIKSGAFHCWRCGPHPRVEVLCRLLGIDPPEARRILQRYGGRRRPLTEEVNAEVRRTQKRLRVRYPSNVSDSLARNHVAYLKSRGFKPGKIKQEWKIKGTGPTATLNGIDFRFRIIIPVYWEGIVSTWQARDVTGKSLGRLRYLTCPKEFEVEPGSRILYRHPEYSGKFGVCVEGITDVWRLGRRAFATFGIGFTRRQVRVIANLYDEVVVLFDSEPQAQKQAAKLCGELRFRGVRVHNHVLPGGVGDPGDLTDREAVELMDEIKNF